MLKSYFFSCTLNVNQLGYFLQVMLRNFNIKMYLLGRLCVLVVEVFKHFDLIKFYQKF